MLSHLKNMDTGSGAKGPWLEKGDFCAPKSAHADVGCHERNAGKSVLRRGFFENDARFSCLTPLENP